MEVSDELYETMKRRDTAFDGRLFVGIATTGIVCFPSCRSRLPKRGNIRVYESVEAALRDGFRPCKRCRPDHPLRQTPDEDVVERVLGILGDRLHQTVTLATLAEELKISPAHLQRVFKRRAGLSPARQLLRMRMERAAELLSDGGLAVGQIAETVGFQNPSHFSSIFKRETGMTPQAYRERAEMDGRRGGAGLRGAADEPPAAGPRAVAGDGGESRPPGV